MLLRNDFGMRTRQAAFDRVWRSIRLALSLALVSVTASPGGPAEGASLSLAQLPTPASAPSLAFARYIASLNRTNRPAEWQTVAIEMEASLPGLAKKHACHGSRRSTSSRSNMRWSSGRGCHREATGIARYLTARKKPRRCRKRPSLFPLRIMNPAT